MAELQNILFGVLIFVAIISGMTLSLNDWFSRTSISGAQLNNTILNTTGAMTYLGDWQSQTANILSNTQAVPFLGNGLVLIAGAFQVLTLIIGIPSQVVVPLINTISGALMLPSWFVGFIVLAIGIFALIGILNAMKGGKV